MIKSFIGHHGTSSEACENILQSNFQLSLGDKEWLGDGVYFFVDGLNKNTIRLAEKWAIAQSWDNRNKCYIYNQYSIIESNISVEENDFLDLTTSDGVEILNYLVTKFENKINTIGKKLDYLDGLLINLARGEGLLSINVVKGNFFIKFTKERIEKINLRTSNCTICCVYEPHKNLSNKRIKKIGNIV